MIEKLKRSRFIIYNITAYKKDGRFFFDAINESNPLSSLLFVNNDRMNGAASLQQEVALKKKKKTIKKKKSAVHC